MITQSKTTTATTIENRKKITLEDIQQNSTKKKLGSTFEQRPRTIIPDNFSQHTKGIAIRP